MSQDYEGPVVFEGASWKPAGQEPMNKEFIEDDTRKPLDSGYMRNQYLAEENAKADISLPLEEEIRKANNSMAISAAMEHARNIPGVEYDSLDHFIVSSEKLYTILLEGFSGVDTE